MDFLHSFRFTVQYKHVATPGNQTVSLHIENISKHFIRLSLIRLPFIAVFLRHQHTKVKKGRSHHETALSLIILVS